MKKPRLSEWLFRLILRLYPGDFRTQYGSEMVEVFLDRWETERTRHHRWIAVRVWSFVLSDLFSTAVEERRRQWRRPIPRTRPQQIFTSPEKLAAMHDFLRDIRFALRGFARKPGFVALVVGTLAVGIGANAAIFSVVNGVLFRPLPYEAPHRLAQLWEAWGDAGSGSVSYPNVIDWREQNEAFEHIVAYQRSNRSLQDLASPERVPSVVADVDLFTMLGVQPLLGRTFQPGDDELGGSGVVVISDQLWKRGFGSDPGLLGQAIRLDGQDHTVIGIMPAEFRFPPNGPRADLWVPLRLTQARATLRASHDHGVVGRLAEGVDIRTAQSRMDGVAQRLEERHPEAQAGRGVWVRALHDQVVGDVRPLLFALFGAVGLVLLIACANVANMLLARTAERTREVALRTALGAGRGRVVRQFLTESILLSSMGALFGVGLAFFGIDVLVHLGGSDIPRSSEIQIDGRVLAFLTLVTVATSIVFGLLPTWFASKLDLMSGLGGGSGREGITRRGRQFRDTLVVAEFTLAFVLVISAGLLVKTMMHLQNVDPGLVAEGVLTMRMSLSEEKYPGGSAGDFYRDVLEGTRNRPGVTEAGFVSLLPLQGYGISGPFTEAGELSEPEPYAEWRLASPGYFRALGVPIVRGRDFSEADNAGTRPVVLINESLVSRYFADRDPVGRLISTPDAPELFLNPGERWMTIVGVVADTKGAGLHRNPRPELYFHYRQIERIDVLGTMSLVIRGRIPATALTSEVRSVVRSVDPGQPVYDIKLMEDVVSDSISGSRFATWLFASFAVIAVVLAGAGIYGIISYLVTQRRIELGVRMALGAGSSDVLFNVVGKGVLLAGLGLVMGVSSSLVGTRVLSGMLVGVSPTDGLTFIATSAFLFLVALAGCAVPAYRALGVDPVEAMRSE